MNQVFIRWIAGSGRRPVTWITLVECLRTIKLLTLVDLIEGQYELITSHDIVTVTPTTTQQNIGEQTLSYSVTSQPQSTPESKLSKV